MITPASDVPSELTAFLGIWAGKWDGLLDVILVVRYVDVYRAEAIISLGKWNDCCIIPQNNYIPYTLAVNKDTRSLQYGTKNSFEYIFEFNKKGDGLIGYFKDYKDRPWGTTLKAELSRVKPEEIPQVKIAYKTLQ